MHIAGVRASCGCTTPRIEKETLKTYEKGAIIAHINSESFLGSQGATLTVTIDKPQYAEVQLQVKVYVYSDVLLEPASIALGSVERGNSRRADDQCPVHRPQRLANCRGQEQQPAFDRDG